MSNFKKNLPGDCNYTRRKSHLKAISLASLSTLVLTLTLNNINEANAMVGPIKVPIPKGATGATGAARPPMFYGSNGARATAGIYTGAYNKPNASKVVGGPTRPGISGGPTRPGISGGPTRPSANIGRGASMSLGDFIRQNPPGKKSGPIISGGGKTPIGPTTGSTTGKVTTGTSTGSTIGKTNAGSTGIKVNADASTSTGSTGVKVSAGTSTGSTTVKVSTGTSTGGKTTVKVSTGTSNDSANDTSASVKVSAGASTSTGGTGLTPKTTSNKSTQTTEDGMDMSGGIDTTTQRPSLTGQLADDGVQGDVPRANSALGSQSSRIDVMLGDDIGPEDSASQVGSVAQSTSQQKKSLFKLPKLSKRQKIGLGVGLGATGIGALGLGLGLGLGLDDRDDRDDDDNRVSPPRLVPVPSAPPVYSTGVSQSATGNLFIDERVD